MFNVSNIQKTYKTTTGSKKALRDINFKVKKGEIVCVLGKSGSGKSTLLRVLAGLEHYQSGSINFSDETIKNSYVSQEYTLWPNSTVLENLTLAPLLNSSRKEEDIFREAKSLLKRFDLEKYNDAYPEELSGGQRQRVALLRAIMYKPEVLLLDEITSALDPELTKSVLDLIRALSKDGYTMLVVTHHMSFALSIADRVIFMKNGEILADQKSTEFFTNQSNPEIRSFILDIAKKDENIEVFKGIEQYQAYHIGLMRRLPEGSTIYVAGAVGDQWYDPMGEFYETYEKMRISKKIIWQMVTYEQGEIDTKLMKEHPELNKFRKMPRELQNPANYNVFEDTVITQIFGDEPTIIQIRNQNIADAYLRFFEELWELAK